MQIDAVIEELLRQRDEEERLEAMDTNEVFAEAIAQGRLSSNPHAPHYSGDYMLMGFEDGVAMFKHYNDRSYLEREVVYRKNIDWTCRAQRRAAVDKEHERRARIKCDHHVFLHWLFTVYFKEQTA